MRLCELPTLLQSLAHIARDVHRVRALGEPPAAISGNFGAILQTLVSEWLDVRSKLVQLDTDLSGLVAARLKRFDEVISDMRALCNRIADALLPANLREKRGSERGKPARSGAVSAAAARTSSDTSAYDQIIAVLPALAEQSTNAFVAALNMLALPIFRHARNMDAHLDRLASVTSGELASVFRPATEEFAALAERVGLMRALYPPMESELSAFLGEAFDAINARNASLAADVNAVLRGPETMTARETLAQELRNCRTLVQSVSDRVDAELSSLSARDLFTVNFVSSLREAASIEHFRIDLYDETIEHMRETGAVARLGQLCAEHKELEGEVTAPVAQLVREADSIGQALQYITYSAQQHDASGIRSAAEAVRPAMGHCTQTVVDVVMQECQRLANDTRDLKQAFACDRAGLADTATHARLVQMLQSYVARLDPSRKHLYEGFDTDESRGAVVRALVVARELLSILERGPSAAHDVGACLERLWDHLDRAVASRQAVMASSQQAAVELLKCNKENLVGAVNAVLREPGNAELEQQLHEACDAFEDIIETFMHKLLPTPASASVPLPDSERNEEQCAALHRAQRAVVAAADPTESLIRRISSIDIEPRTVPPADPATPAASAAALATVPLASAPSEQRVPKRSFVHGTVPEIIDGFECIISRNSSDSSPKLPPAVPQPGRVERAVSGAARRLGTLPPAPAPGREGRPSCEPTPPLTARTQAGACTRSIADRVAVTRWTSQPARRRAPRHQAPWPTPSARHRWWSAGCCRARTQARATLPVRTRRRCRTQSPSTIRCRRWRAKRPPAAASSAAQPAKSACCMARYRS